MERTIKVKLGTKCDFFYNDIAIIGDVDNVEDCDRLCFSKANMRALHFLIGKQSVHTKEIPLQ